jgi:CBS domain-containing protein
MAMDGYGRDPRGARGRGDGVRYVPDAAPQSGMYPGPWGAGRFTFRRSDGSWYDEEFTGHNAAEGTVWEGGRHGPVHGPYDQAWMHDGGYGAPRQGGPGGGHARGWAQGRGGQDGGEQRGGSDSDRIRAWQIMTEDPTAVTADTTLAVAAQLMRELDVGVIPVVDDDEGGRLVGVITDRDMVVRALADGKDGKATVGDHMTAEVTTVAPGDSVHDVLDVMKHERVRRVPVTDADGRLVGIISQADLAVSYAGLDIEREAEVEEAIERISEPRVFRDRHSHGIRRGRPY